MRDLLEHPDFVELALPRYERMKVNLMAAPAAVGDIAYRDTSEVAAECDLVARLAFCGDVHNLRITWDRLLGDGKQALCLRPRSTSRRSARRLRPSTATSWVGG